MNGKLLLFGFDSLLNVLALEAAMGPLGVELVPVARKDYNKPLAVLAGLDAAPGPMADYAGDPLGWQKKCLVNIAKAGFFSSDRTIAEYDRDIWHLG